MTDGRNGGADVYFPSGVGTVQGMVTSTRIVIILVAALGLATFLKKGYPSWYSYNA